MELQAAAAQFDMAGKLLALSHVKGTTTRKGKAGDETVIINPANAPVFNAAAKLNEGASILWRRAVGLPVEVRRSELTGAEGGPVQVQNDDGQTDEQRREKLAALSRIAAFLAEGGERGAGNGADDDPAG